MYSRVSGKVCSVSVECRRRHGESVRRSSLWATECSSAATSRKTAAREQTQARSLSAQARLHRGSQLQQPAPRALARPGRVAAMAHVPMSSSLCIDANGKPGLALPSAGADRDDLIIAVVLLCLTAQGTTLGLTALTGLLHGRRAGSPVSKGADIAAQASWLSGISRTRGAAESQRKDSASHPIQGFR